MEQGRPLNSADVFTYLGGWIPVRCYEHMGIVHFGGDPAGMGTEFVREGLERGHWCYFAAPPDPSGDMVRRLRERGVELDRHLIGRSLQFPPAAPDGVDLLEQARRFVAEAEAAHAPATRWLEDGVWATSASTSLPYFFEQHARLNYVVKLFPSVALCQYDAQRMEIPHLFTVIAVHRHLLVEGSLVRDNPFYIPAERFIAMSPEERASDLRAVFREVGFDVKKLLSVLAGYGQLQRPPGG